MVRLQSDTGVEPWPVTIPITTWVLCSLIDASGARRWQRRYATASGTQYRYTARDRHGAQWTAAAAAVPLRLLLMLTGASSAAASASSAPARIQLPHVTVDISPTVAFGPY